MSHACTCNFDGVSRCFDAFIDVFGACADTHSANALLRAYSRRRSYGQYTKSPVLEGVRYAHKDVHGSAFLRVKECDKGTVTHTDHTMSV